MKCVLYKKNKLSIKMTKKLKSQEKNKYFQWNYYRVYRF